MSEKNGMIYEMKKSNTRSEKAEKTVGILSAQEHKMSAEFEKRLTHLSEFCSYMHLSLNTSDEIEDPSEYLDLLFKELSSYGGKFNFHSELMSKNKRTVSEGLNSLYDFDRALLSEGIVRKWEESQGESANILLLLNASEFLTGRISYVKNRYSDKAFDILSLCVDEAKFSYAQNFQAVCENITQGFSEYGILPFSDSQGTIETVNRLLSAYELKICAVCDIATQDENMTRFALISDKLCVNLEAENRYFSFSFNSDEPYKMRSVLYASELYGLSLYEMKVTPSYAGSADYKMTFREGSGDLVALFVYLKLFLPQFIINGIYFEI